MNQFFESFNGMTPLCRAVVRVLKASYGINSVLSPDVPFSFSRGGKSYVGYYAFSDKLTIRFEAPANRKNDLTSISVWDTGTSLDAAPRILINLTAGVDLGSASMIADAIANGAPSEPSEHVMEASSSIREATADIIRQFVNEVGDEGGSYSSMYRKYMQWAQEHGERIVSDITFTEYLKGIRGKSTSTATTVQVSAGVPDDPASQPIEYDEFEQEILNNSVLYKYAMLAEIVKKIVTWDPLYRNAFIYGVGGVGKTFTVMQTINEFADPSKVVVYKGAISGFTGLLQILWQDRAGKVIILDDNDAILENTNALNLLKGAMENADPRIVSYTRFKKGAPTRASEKRGILIDVSRLYERVVSVYSLGEKIFEEKVTPAEARWYEKASGIRVDKHALREDFGEDDELEDIDDISALDPDIDPAYGMDPDEAVPDQFQFTSRVIFISNLMNVPQPLMDRCISIGLLLTKQQILDLIEDKIDFIMKKEAPNVTLDEKKEVLAFMRKYVHRIGKPLTFRLFMQLVAIQHSGHPDAKKMMYLTMLGEGMKSKLR